jgi:adenosylhomocysteine nucleosidase
MSLTLVCFAVKEEAAPFRKNSDRFPSVKILVTGMGHRNAIASFEKFLSTAKPELVLTCGFAGGLNPAFKIGDVVFETIEQDLRAKLLALGARTAEFFSAGQVAITAKEKREWYLETGCDVVEMESEAIFDICYQRQIPCAIIRVISDAADDELPLDFNALMTPDQRLSFPKLALALMKSPGKIPQLMQLQKNTRLAAQKLAGVLEKLLSDRIR